MVGAEETVKRCPVCGFDLPRSMWPKNKASSTGYGSCCNPCSAAKSRKDRLKPGHNAKANIPKAKYKKTEKGKAAEARYNSTDKRSKVLSRSNYKRKVEGTKTEEYINRKYKLSRSDYREAKKLTHCRLCGSEFTVESPMVVDHCHVSGIVRGFIHQHCNSMLGFSGDSIETLQAGIKYLKEEKQMSGWFYYGL
jgi:hypothetical protein